MIAVKRNRLIYAGVTVCVLCAAVLFTVLDGGEDTVRYHQHLEQPAESVLGDKPESDGLVTHLPIIEIDTTKDGRYQKIPGKAIMDEQQNSVIGEGTGENGETEITARLRTIETEGEWHDSEDEADYESDILIHIRGNSSRAFDKSNYRIKLIEDDDPLQKKSLPLLGMDESADWVLHGPFLDKTLIRNYMWMNISAESMGYAPNVRFCELILDGDYMGVYVLMETIEVSESRVDLTPYEAGDPVMSYMIHIEPKAELDRSVETFSFYAKKLEPERQIEISYPGTQDLTEEVKKYIQADFSEIEQAIYSDEAGSDPDFYLEYLDEQSFVDYYILQEFVGNNDMFQASTYFYKDVRGKLHIGPVWDYNNVLDNYTTVMPAEGFLLSQNGFYSQLMKSERFVDRVISRYRQLRVGLLSEKYLRTYIRQTESWLGSAVDRNYTVWGYTWNWEQIPMYERRRPDIGSGETFADVNPASYEEATEDMISYMVRRGDWLDDHIESLRQYCQTSKNAATVLY